MSMLDPYAGASAYDLIRYVQALSARVAAVEARERQRPGIPVTQASGPLLIPPGTPSTPPSGFYLYASGSEARWRSASGADYSLVPPTIPQGSAVSDVTGEADTTYSGNEANLINDTKGRLNQLLASLRFAGLISSF
ncbi:hypothetical protein ACIBG7_18550 [Nonomuraea sp. NPDC050328]|uniref:hypothetical protein n=1 Tax=Nonomuraea sp. NPDC050328 TaxID=3364361 RepID=UPI0037BB6444